LTNPVLHTAAKEAIRLPEIFQRYRLDIGQALQCGLSGQGIRVYDMLRYYMGWVDADGVPCVATQGKALRPTLCLLACEAVGGSIRAAMPAAMALEFIHNFSLIHDDIQDKDATRHHRPTMWVVWGVPKALVAGNVLRLVADMSLERLLDEGLEPERVLAVVQMLTQAYLEMIEGQYLDLAYEGRQDISLNAYLDMISRKTGALIRCSLTIGALIGTPDAATVAAFRACGTSLGYVFQIRDDYLGVWGEEETTGKPVGADIRRKKNSFPVVYAMSCARGKDRQLLAETYQKEQLGDDDVAAVLDVMERVNARGYAQDLASEHCARAMDALAHVELAPEFRQSLEELAHFLLVRQH
jgi:geranylgeranyl diphosphate synthase type I